jgi:hypothetical protein
MKIKVLILIFIFIIITGLLILKLVFHDDGCLPRKSPNDPCFLINDK